MTAELAAGLSGRKGTAIKLLIFPKGEVATKEVTPYKGYYYHSDLETKRRAEFFW